MKKRECRKNAVPGAFDFFIPACRRKISRYIFGIGTYDIIGATVIEHQ